MTLKLTDATFMTQPRAGENPAPAVMRRVITQYRQYTPDFLDGFTDEEIEAQWMALPADIRQQWLSLSQ